MKHIPLDKSWIIRMGVLDIAHGRNRINTFLNKQKDLGDDLIALRRAAQDWKSQKAIDVGESGTLYRFLQFTSWKLGANKRFIKRGTLRHRKIASNPDLVSYPIEKLLMLDNGTSQWASASLLLGNKEKPKDVPYKLKVTIDALKHWKNNRAWQPRYDDTIQKQAEVFTKLIQHKKVKFNPQQAEDFCFAYTFGYISKQEAEKRWPSLRGHESDRIVEMEEMLNNAKTGKIVKSKDHRVVQAIAMWGLLNKKKVKFKYPNSVNKSWPQFWKFLNTCS
jgi:hypothetical protein